MTQSFKKAFVVTGSVVWAAILIGISYWGFFLIPYHFFLRMKPYTGTIWGAMKVLGYPAYCPFYFFLLAIFCWLYTKKDKSERIPLTSIIIIFGAAVSVLITWKITDGFLSKRIVYTGNCSVIGAQALDEGTNRHVVVTIMCANGQSFQDETADMIALAINHPTKQLTCNISATNILDCSHLTK